MADDPICDLHAEQAVLGALMLANGHAETRSLVTAHDFYRGAHRSIYEAISALADTRTTVDAVTVADHLGNKLADVGGHQALTELVAATPHAGSGPHYAAIVAEHARRRRVRDAAENLAKRASDRTIDVDSLVADAVDAMQRQAGSSGVVTTPGLIERALQRADGPPERGWSPPWPALANAWRIVPGWVHVVTGFPSAGKSAFVDALVVGLAEREDVRITVWSPESAPCEAHAIRMAELHAGRDQLDPARMVEHLTWATERITWIDHDQVSTLPGILANAATTKPDILVIDPFTDVDKWDAEQGEGWDRMLERQLTRSRAWARAHQVALIIVAHPKGIQRAPSGVYPVATISDLHGGAVWRNKLDSAVSVWRDEQGHQRAREQIDVHVQKIRDEGAAGQMGRRVTLTRHADRGGRYYGVQALGGREAI